MTPTPPTPAGPAGPHIHIRILVPGEVTIYSCFDEMKNKARWGLPNENRGQRVRYAFEVENAYFNPKAPGWVLWAAWGKTMAARLEDVVMPPTKKPGACQQQQVLRQ